MNTVRSANQARILWTAVALALITALSYVLMALIYVITLSWRKSPNR